MNFKLGNYEKHRQLFEELKNTQKPHTLFITCSDSRIDPNMLTGTLPGELFIVRNVANIVPPYRENAEYAATTSAIEYGVLMLGVENIIVCGHSHCGGCAASFEPEENMEDLPHTKKWLELIQPVKERIQRDYPEKPQQVKAWMMEKMNVVEQLGNLMTYPYIYERVKAGKLALGGWYYIIGSGEVYIYDSITGTFCLGNKC